MAGEGITKHYSRTISQNPTKGVARGVDHVLMTPTITRLASLFLPSCLACLLDAYDRKAFHFNHLEFLEILKFFDFSRHGTRFLESLSFRIRIEH